MIRIRNIATDLEGLEKGDEGVRPAERALPLR